MTTIRAFPRLHLGLFDLGTATPRKYGGIGVSVDGLPTVVTAERSPTSDLSLFPVLDHQATEDISRIIADLSSLHSLPPMRIDVHVPVPQHVGLGAKTAILLAVVQALHTEGRKPIDKTALIRSSGRGGTSGIGIHAFFEGGLIMDGGHRSSPPRTYAPSSATSPHDLPPLVARISMPIQWRVTLLLPSGERLRGRAEEAFFAAHTPLSHGDIERVIALAVSGLAASVASDDFRTFADVLREFQSIGFKAREIANQSRATRMLLTSLWDINECAAGMSSMGPLLFAITEASNASAVAQISEVSAAYEAQLLGTFAFRNAGHQID